MGTKIRRGGVLSAALVAACGMSLVAAPAQAQPNTKKKVEVRAEPPTPRKSDNPPTIWNYLILFVILAAVFGANMIPSKRGHQD
jgi:hypothetical protein